MYILFTSLLNNIKKYISFHRDFTIYTYIKRKK